MESINQDLKLCFKLCSFLSDESSGTASREGFIRLIGEPEKQAENQLDLFPEQEGRFHLYGFVSSQRIPRYSGEFG